ncbi:MAG: hypothetical protein WCJ01_11285 [Ignavibacteria bacterium]
MKKILFILIIVSSAVFGQFREQLNNQPGVHDGMISNNTPSMVLGFINPNNFQMHHSYSLSYSAFGGNGLAVGIYTNSMLYKFNNELNLQVDASLVHTPYSSFGKGTMDNINGIYVSRAELNYRPGKDFLINIQYNRLPYNYYPPNGSVGYGYTGGFPRFNQDIMNNGW